MSVGMFSHVVCQLSVQLSEIAFYNHFTIILHIAIPIGVVYMPV